MGIGRRALQTKKAVQNESGWPLPRHNSQEVVEMRRVKLHDVEVFARGQRMSRGFFTLSVKGVSRLRGQICYKQPTV